MLIGICGLIGSGKDPVAERLVNEHGYKRDSFAKSLKDAVASMFNWDRDMLEGRGEGAPKTGRQAVLPPSPAPTRRRRTTNTTPS